MNACEIFAILIFSAVGLGYFRYATKTASYVPLICSLLLFFYPYFCQRAWQIFLFGSLISAIPLIVSFWRGR